ncbi:hypothetical protein CANCADRAFT_30361 [Tortispora caseinolytica NRRL Y-17796]|uniref:tRNA pseudouridine synthase 1 n=1 Tax=Tortispora caseinolytica NRRL Y-17796 TaxID=767744 RepID=A0A1E4TK33_9ASCO|nr:hypothetical protein CANCADRAFT_30361 [Tortispora caseinolytica NRRL Y-17796]
MESNGNTTDIKRKPDESDEASSGIGLDKRRKLSRPPDPSIPREPRLPKKKVVVLIGYCGSGYHGIQLNPPHKTIEGEIFQAMVSAGAVWSLNADDPRKLSLIRAARTDKGVHAAGNVLSLKLVIEDPAIIEKINSYLPETIRIWHISRINKSFECRRMCGSRVYEYMLPTYSFLSPKPGTHLAKMITSDTGSDCQKYWESVLDDYRNNGLVPEEVFRVEHTAFDENSKEPKPLSSNDEKIRDKVREIDSKHRTAYRIESDRLTRFREILNKYLGSHNFYNYTVGKDFKDPSAIRHMKSITVSEPFCINDMEWVSVKIHGDSFMLHQIRKMISLAVLVVRVGAPSKLIDDSFQKVKINIPKAPALGLLLDHPVYDAGNEVLEKNGYEPINFDKYKDQIDEFKSKFIYSKIYEEEQEYGTFNSFFSFVDRFSAIRTFQYLYQGINESTASGNTELDDDDYYEED